MSLDLFGPDAGDRARDSAVKVRFALDEAYGSSSEGMWARSLPSGTYLITNIPYFAYGVSYLDEIEAVEGGDGRLWGHRVVRHSGYVTLRVVLTASEEARASRGVSELVDRLRRLDIGFEIHHHYALLSLNVGETDDIPSLLQLLRWFEEDGLGLWEIGACRPWWWARQE